MEVEGQEPERDQRRRKGRREQLRRQQVQRRRLVAVGAFGALVLAAVLLIPHIGGSNDPAAAQPEAAPKPTGLERRRGDPDQQGQAIEDVLGYTRFIHEGQPREREVALTFDDGPGPYTDEILRILRRTDTPATFFVLGNMVDEGPE